MRIARPRWVFTVGILVSLLLLWVAPAGQVSAATISVDRGILTASVAPAPVESSVTSFDRGWIHGDFLIYMANTSAMGLTPTDRVWTNGGGQTPTRADNIVSSSSSDADTTAALFENSVLPILIVLSFFDTVETMVASPSIGALPTLVSNDTPITIQFAATATSADAPSGSLGATPSDQYNGPGISPILDWSGSTNDVVSPAMADFTLRFISDSAPIPSQVSEPTYYVTSYPIVVTDRSRNTYLLERPYSSINAHTTAARSQMDTDPRVLVTLPVFDPATVFGLSAVQPKTLTVTSANATVNNTGISAWNPVATTTTLITGDNGGAISVLTASSSNPGMEVLDNMSTQRSDYASDFNGTTAH